MLYVAIGSGIVSILSLINNGSFLYELLMFDKAQILKGQIWRLFTFVFTEQSAVNPALNLIFLYFFYRIGRRVELTIGTLKFNLFYFSGIVLMDVFAMVFCPIETVVIDGYAVTPELFSYVIYGDLAWFLHLSLVLLFATTNPDTQFIVLFIIPVQAWFMGVVYLVLVAIEIFNLSSPAFLFPHNLFPLVGLANYLLFVGSDVLNLFPFIQRRPKKSVIHPGRTGTIPFRPHQAAKKQDYSHRCTVCGRTDVSDPELEFRYCSRCSGYHCYCQDHINDHVHVQE
jgi:uncharacterized paraquat-inducible protein A